MHIRKIELQAFKRFTDLTINDLPESAKLVILVGPNGCGKSSIFDSFNVWRTYGLNVSGTSWDVNYHSKNNISQYTPNNVSIHFHEAPSADINSKKKTFYIRTAYRNEAEFSISGLSQAGSIYDAPRPYNMTQNETIVSDNYRRMVSMTVDKLFSRKYDNAYAKNIREELVGEVREILLKLFPDLLLIGPGDPLGNGSFFFEKGNSLNFLYKNLSGGEKAAFDLVLDLVLKKNAYDDTIYCIDEPEAHMHTKLQSKLLEVMYDIIPDTSQLWISSHSIGMIRKAKDLNEANPGTVVFLDFHGKDFDGKVEIFPSNSSRRLWANMLDIALDDMASLVAPKRVVFCEGSPRKADKGNEEFDAKCYRIIFGEEFCDTDFISVGSSSEVLSDKLGLEMSFQTIVKGTEVLRLIDKDDRSPIDIEQLKNQGVRVLTRRHLEAYLFDDEILSLLCESVEHPEKKEELLSKKKEEIENSVKRGNPPDDVKSAAGKLYNFSKILLGLTGCGINQYSFMRDTLAPLVKPGTETYRQLKEDILGD